jgi:FkbM family methyltransferase
MAFTLLFGIQRVFGFFGLHVSRRTKGAAVDSSETEQFRLLGEDVTCIVEVGAADGRDSLMYAERYKNARVFAFEPLPESFRKLEDISHSNDRVIAVNQAVSNRVGKAVFNITTLADASSLLPPLVTGSSFDRYTVPAGTIEVDVTSLDAFAAKNGIGQIDLLKMDAQGAEIQVLEGARELLKNNAIRMVYSEIDFTDLYVGGGRWYALASLLYDHGFKLHNFYNLYHNQNGQLCWGDAIFVRSS